MGLTNPTKASLYLNQVITDLDRQNRIDEVLYENAVEQLLNMAFNAVDTVHNLDKSVLARLKYVFRSSKE